MELRGKVRRHRNSNDAYAYTGRYNVARAYTANGLNQYTAAGGVSMAYDARGNLATSGTSGYAYSKRNELTGTASVALSYDGAGRLIQYSAGTPTRFAYAGASLIAEANTSGTLLRRYVPGPGTDEVLVWYEGAGTADRRWLQADERGSVVAVSDSAGGVLAINRYDEYGIPQPGNLGRFQYTGQTWFAELGLYNYKARMYSPTLGRFMQTDPIGYGDGLNWHNYAHGDPVNGTDSSGMLEDAYFVSGETCTGAWCGSEQPLNSHRSYDGMGFAFFRAGMTRIVSGRIDAMRLDAALSAPRFDFTSSVSSCYQGECTSGSEVDVPDDLDNIALGLPIALGYGATANAMAGTPLVGMAGSASLTNMRFPNGQTATLLTGGFAATGAGESATSPNGSFPFIFGLGAGIGPTFSFSNAARPADLAGKFSHFDIQIPMVGAASVAWGSGIIHIDLSPNIFGPLGALGGGVSKYDTYTCILNSGC